MSRLVLVACGAQKADRKLPACLLYTGPYFRACLQYACSLGSWRDVRILSAKHGLVYPIAELEPYNVPLGDPAAITADELRRQAEAEGLLELASPVVVVGGAGYRLLAAQVWGEVGIRNPLAAAGGGIGKQLAWLKRNTPRWELCEEGR